MMMFDCWNKELQGFKGSANSKPCPYGFFFFLNDIFQRQTKKREGICIVRSSSSIPERKAFVGRPFVSVLFPSHLAFGFWFLVFGRGFFCTTGISFFLDLGIARIKWRKGGVV